MIEHNPIVTISSYATSYGNRFDLESAAKEYQVVQDLETFMASNLDIAYTPSTVHDMAKCIIENRLDIIKFLESLDD